VKFFPVRPPFYLLRTAQVNCWDRGRPRPLVARKASGRKPFVLRTRAGEGARGPSNSAYQRSNLNSKLTHYPLEALLDKALSRSLNYAIRNQAGPLTCMFPAIYIRSSVVETNHLDGD